MLLSIMIIANIRIKEVTLCKAKEGENREQKINEVYSERRHRERTTRRFCSPGIVVMDMMGQNYSTPPSLGKQAAQGWQAEKKRKRNKG